MKFLAKNLTFLRNKVNKTQAEISIQQGFSRSTWNNYEKGKSKPGLDDFVKLSKYFDIDEGVLLHVDISKHSDMSFPNRQNENYIAVKNTNKLDADTEPISHVNEAEPEYITVIGLKLKNLENEIALKDRIISGKDELIQALNGQIEILKEAQELLRQRLKDK